MLLRISKKNITFRNSFQLGDSDKVYVSGVYCVETVEEVLEGNSFLTYIEVTTFFHTHPIIEQTGGELVIFIAPINLEAALWEDLQKEKDKGVIRQSDNKEVSPFN